MFTNSIQEWTFTEVLKQCQKSDISSEANIDNFLKDQNRHVQTPFHTNGFSYIFDFKQNKFLHVSDSIRHVMGYKPQDFLNKGFEHFVLLLHKEDFRIFNEKIFPQDLSFLHKLSPSEHPNVVFSFNYRIKNKAGDWLHFYERYFYITSLATGLPSLTFGLATNITNYKRDATIIYQVDRIDIHGNSLKPIKVNYFYPDTETGILSAQERKVLTLLSQGLNSREIAKRLFLSENTIINHRRNMQLKTNTKNIAELIFYAAKQGIL